eukprot:GHVN01003578.1.p1 GENE.GHVN01003578.1~~GHVN01003578.1.p1  ORF type:complete len:229 (+),score=16.55 GHVN01003578.1:184-870(+)
MVRRGLLFIHQQCLQVWLHVRRWDCSLKKTRLTAMKDIFGHCTKAKHFAIAAETPLAMSVGIIATSLVSSAVISGLLVYSVFASSYRLTRFIEDNTRKAKKLGKRWLLATIIMHLAVCISEGLGWARTSLSTAMLFYSYFFIDRFEEKRRSFYWLLLLCLFFGLNICSWVFYFEESEEHTSLLDSVLFCFLFVVFPVYLVLVFICCKIYDLYERHEEEDIGADENMFY